MFLCQTVGWTCTSSAPKWCPTTVSRTCGTSRRCTAATWPRWSRPTTPRDPWWLTCAYRNSRLEVSKRKRVCVSVWVTSYIMLTKTMCESIVSCNVEQKTREHPQDWVKMSREIPEGVWLEVIEHDQSRRAFVINICLRRKQKRNE